jgi:hypothetical protein
VHILGPTKAGLVTVIIAKLDWRPGELAVMVTKPAVAEVTANVAIAEMLPSWIVVVSDAFTTARSELLI